MSFPKRNKILFRNKNSKNTGKSSKINVSYKNNTPAPVSVFIRKGRKLKNLNEITKEHTHDHHFGAIYRVTSEKFRGKKRRKFIKCTKIQETVAKREERNRMSSSSFSFKKELR